MFLYSDYYNRITTKLSQARILASWASVYTDAPFRQTRPPARFAKPACWGHPQSPYDCQLRCQAERRFTPLVTITYNKKQGKADPESIHFCPALLITTVIILSAAVWRLPALSSDHRRRTAPRSVWPSATPAFPVLLPGSLCRLPFSEQSAVHIPAVVL